MVGGVYIIELSRAVDLSGSIELDEVSRTIAGTSFFSVDSGCARL